MDIYLKRITLFLLLTVFATIGNFAKADLIKFTESTTKALPGASITPFLDSGFLRKTSEQEGFSEEPKTRTDAFLLPGSTVFSGFDSSIGELTGVKITFNTLQSAAGQLQISQPANIADSYTQIN